MPNKETTKKLWAGREAMRQIAARSLTVEFLRSQQGA